MVLFYWTIPIMVLMVVMTVLPLALAMAWEARGARVTPVQIDEAASEVRSGTGRETALIRRAEAVARRSVDEAEGVAGREPPAAAA